MVRIALSDDAGLAHGLHLRAVVAHLSQHLFGVFANRGRPPRDIHAPTATDVRALPGMGLSGMVDGVALQLGSERLRASLGAAAGTLEAQAQALQQAGRTVSWLIEMGAGDASPAQHRVVGLVAFGDAIKPGARRAIERLRAAGVRTVMLSGDNQGAAARVAKTLGLDEVQAEVLPADKAERVNGLKADGTAVAMVGDGINDAPALAAADVGIAMSTGTDVAMHAAGITLMRGDPALVADALAISHRTVRKIRENLFWAFFYNVIGIPLAAAGLLNPVVAGAAMAFSSVSVVGNALLLRRWKPAGEQA